MLPSNVVRGGRVWGNLTSFVTLRRRTAVIVESAAAGATLTVAHQPVRESLVEVSLSSSGGAPGTGTVTVTGIAAGATVTEVLTFSGLGVKQTTRLFSSVAGMTTTGLADETPIPVLSARAVGRDGSAQHGFFTVAKDYPAALDERVGRYRADPAGGSAQDDTARLALPYSDTFAPREGDLVDDGQGRTWMITTSPPQLGALQPEFWHLAVKRFEAEP